MANHPVWDLPTRVFHWLLLCAVTTSWASYELDNFTVHERSGYTVLVLVLFRISWGFVGSLHSRFSDFLTGPGEVLRYLKGNRGHRPGHNPLGAWSVVIMLLLLLVQASTGLFNSDGLMYDGPLYHALDSSWTDKLGEVHDTLFWALLGFILLHVGSVMFYQFRKKQDLIRPMISGGEEGGAAPVPAWRSLVVVAIFSGLLATAVYYAPKPTLPW